MNKMFIFIFIFFFDSIIQQVMYLTKLSTDRS